MKSPQEIILIIYHILKEGPQSIDSLYVRLKEHQILISKRSLYRYISRIESSGLPNHLVFEIEQENKNRKTFFIREIPKKIAISEIEWLTFLNSTLVAQNLFSHQEEEIKAFSKINRYLFQHAPLKSQLVSMFNGNINIVKSSRFGELLPDIRIKKLLNKFTYYFSLGSCLEIINYTPKVKNNRFIPEVKQPLIPLMIGYHRGNFTLYFHAKKECKIFGLEIEMIQDLNFSNEKFTENERNIYLEKVKATSFGYHQSIIPGLYNVVLEFPENPGEHIINRFWHANQKFTRKENGIIRLEFTAEINIELIGWIAMWLDNIKVIGPEVLIKILDSKYNKMLAILRNNMNPINNG